MVRSSAIYRFARSADDIADEGDASSDARLAALDHYAVMLDAHRDAATHRDEAPFLALAHEIRAHELPLAPLRALLSAFRQDVVKTRYADFPDLADYCARSANPVGRLLLHLYGVDDEYSQAQSDAICTGLQLANFWQDIAVDWTKGRVYLPQDDLRSYGCRRSTNRRGPLRRALDAAARLRGRTNTRVARIGARPDTQVAAPPQNRIEPDRCRRLADPAPHRRDWRRCVPASADAHTT